MKILVLNCGSSSVKYKLIDSKSHAVLAEGGVEKIGLPDSFLKFKRPDGSKETIVTKMADAKDAVAEVIKVLTDEKEGVIKWPDMPTLLYSRRLKPATSPISSFSVSPAQVP